MIVAFRIHHRPINIKSRCAATGGQVNESGMPLRKVQSGRAWEGFRAEMDTELG